MIVIGSIQKYPRIGPADSLKVRELRVSGYGVVIPKAGSAARQAENRIWAFR